MSKIHVLSEEVANQIAAGEVVERPASVVKELLDNAVDAGAGSVKVEIELGGVKKILVVDDGEGMDKEDLQRCVVRHGTSKIQRVDDLLHINSMGFRGEALSSISAVSRFSVKSKQPGQTGGWEFRGEKSKFEVVPVGMPEGTSVLVEDLFFNVPARKKFLKSVSTEFRHIVEVVNNFALAFPAVGFSLKHNGKLVLNYSAGLGMRNRVKQVLGKTIFEQLIPVHFDHSHLKIDGFVGKPEASYEGKYKQFLFVNKRRVTDRVVTKMVKDAYGTLLPVRVYPVFVLFVSSLPEMVDVNVHPRKEEVKFVNAQFVYSSVNRVVKHVLEKTDLTFGKENGVLNSDGLRSGGVAGERRSVPAYISKNVSVYGQREATDVVNSPFGLNQISEKVLPWDDQVLMKTEETGKVLQVHNLYLITQTVNGILIVDQHAAHERVRYEELLKEFAVKKNEKVRQGLLVPVKLELSVDESEMLSESLEVFVKLGFEIDKVKQNVFEIKSVPALLSDNNSVRLVTEVLSDLMNEDGLREVDDQSLRILTYMSCRSAVKAGDRLSEQEIRHIVESLDKTDVKYTCPHGRPVKIEISKNELERMFKRTGF